MIHLALPPAAGTSPGTLEQAAYALQELFPSGLFALTVIMSVVLVAVGMGLVVTSDLKRNNFRVSFKSAMLDDRQALLDEALLANPSAAWKNLLSDLQEELDCEVWGVTPEQLPRARAAKDAIRAGVPVHEKDDAATIKEKVRLAELRRSRQTAKLLIAPEFQKNAESPA